MHAINLVGHVSRFLVIASRSVVACIARRRREAMQTASLTDDNAARCAATPRAVDAESGDVP
jgi:hypothetical protein